MKLRNFEEKDLQKKKEMDKNLDQFKLENIQSLWYFVISAQKKAIAGSKG